MNLRLSNGVKARATQFDSSAISDWHREKLGTDCPAVDCDFILCEYTHAEPCALIEYKHQNSKPVDLKHASYVALAKLATSHHIPFFVVTYSPCLSAFRIQPASEIAERLLNQIDPICVSERTFIKFHRWIRRRSYQRSLYASSDNNQNRLNRA